MEIFQPIWKFITGKQFSAIIFAAIVIWEIRRGFLVQFPSYIRSVSRAVYFWIFAAAAAITVFLFMFDSALIEMVHAIKAPWAIELINFGVGWGRSGKLWSGFAILYLILRVFRFNFAGYLIFGALISSGLTSLLVHIIKYIFVRARPELDFGPYCIFDYQTFLQYGNKCLSFASGDAALAAGFMNFLFLAVKSPVRFVFPLIALTTCFSRMFENKHWPSDVAFSFVISFAFAKLVWDYLKFKFPEFAASSKELRSRS